MKFAGMSGWGMVSYNQVACQPEQDIVLFTRQCLALFSIPITQAHFTFWLQFVSVWAE